MTRATGAGSGMHLDVSHVRVVRGATGSSQILGTSNIPELRKLLRTEKSIGEIADHFGIDRVTLRSFIKRRNICDMRARLYFITLQRSLAREDARIAQMESSRIVGGRARTQAPLRAPNCPDVEGS